MLPQTLIVASHSPTHTVTKYLPGAVAMKTHTKHSRRSHSGDHLHHRGQQDDKDEPEVTTAEEGCSQTVRLGSLQVLSEPSLKGEAEVIQKEAGWSLETKRASALGTGPHMGKGMEARKS